MLIFLFSLPELGSRLCDRILELPHGRENDVGGGDPELEGGHHIVVGAVVTNQGRHPGVLLKKLQLLRDDLKKNIFVFHPSEILVSINSLTSEAPFWLH